MGIVTEVRRRTRSALVPFLLVLVILYFGTSFVEGNRGLLAWISLTQQNNEALTTLQELRSERISREHLVSGLRTNSLDLDLLDEQARFSLGFVAQNDYVLLQ